MASRRPRSRFWTPRCECQRGCSSGSLLETRPRRAPAETRMRTLVVIEAQIPWQSGRAPRRARIGAPIGPLAQERLNEAFGLAVGPGRVRAREAMAELPRATGPGKPPRAIAAAIVRE